MKPFANMSPGADAMQAEQVVRGLYRGLLGRAPEPGALHHWSEAMQSDGGDVALVARAIVGSAEYASNLQNKAHGKVVEGDLIRAAAPLIAQQPLTVVDVGAQELACEAHVYSALTQLGLPCRVIGFEPQEDKIAESNLRHPAGQVVMYPTFIGDGGKHLFHCNNEDATSSLLPFNAELTDSLVGLSQLRTVRCEPVQTQTLDQTLVDVDRVDFLKLDIQGFELTALQNATEVLKRTNVVHCEVSFAEIYQGQALFSEVEQCLRLAGFYFLDFSSMCRYPYHCSSATVSADRLGWGDAVFFKKSALLKSTRDLLVQALSAAFVYEKYAFAESLMELCE